MDYLYIVFLSLGSIIILFALTKLMGNKEISQLSLFDYITGITIGSITAEMATNLENFMKPLIAMIVYGVVATLISMASYKSIRVRKFFAGKPIILYEDTQLYNENLRKAKMDVNEFLTECRNQGYFDLSYIDTAILETNGKISIVPASDHRPVTTKDLQLKPEQEKPVFNVIIDGQILKNTLRETGNDEKWLRSLLHTQGIEDLHEVFLATCDNKNDLRIYRRSSTRCEKSMFE